MKPDFAAGLKKLKQPDLLPETVPEEKPKKPVQASREKKVSIAGYFDPEVRVQLAVMAARQRKNQVDLMAEAFNLLFEKYGEPPIARS
ncbi:ribbon-helix-helix domain-containing protein [Chthonobacter rhizosphaerae]|uniref:ribbon-helix-helix domain-containing protein n=1 Tax=Chthonobacter rhizosphaerae TaxID=2735553 RepID=UPI0015EF96AB|nr:ribbon-helix-helix domain-containing protein [Chthonobacter rhizosphaerae]